MALCPKCGTPMDYIGRSRQWYCPNCRIYNPEPDLNPYPTTGSHPKSRKNIKLIFILIIIIIVIFASLVYILMLEFTEPSFELVKAELLIKDYNDTAESINVGDTQFSYGYKFNNIPNEDQDARITIKFIKDGEIVGTYNMTFTISDRMGSASGIEYLGDMIIPVPDKYRVELYLEDKLMDSIERDF